MVDLGQYGGLPAGDRPVRSPFRALLAGAVCGLGALAILAVLEPVTGVALPLNRFTLFTAAVLGVPGVTAVLILQLLL